MAIPELVGPVVTSEGLTGVAPPAVTSVQGTVYTSRRVEPDGTEIYTRTCEGSNPGSERFFGTWIVCELAWRLWIKARVHHEVMVQSEIFSGTLLGVSDYGIVKANSFRQAVLESKMIHMCHQLELKFDRKN